MKFTQAFEKIKEKIKNADVSDIEDFAVQVTLTNKDCGGIFYIQIKEGHLIIEPYDYRDNNAALATMYGVFNKLLDGKTAPMKAVEKGTLYTTGDAVRAFEILSRLETPKPTGKETKN